MTTAFYAYPSKPASCGDVIIAAIDEINAAHEVSIKPWSRLSINGKLIISEILKEIDRADLLMADLTDLNPNVLFEVGYAIGKEKRVWFSVDRSLRSSNEKLNTFRVFSTIGYADYQNSVDLVKHFYRDRPHEDLLSNLYSDTIAPTLESIDELEPNLLYVKSRHSNQASIALDRRLQANRFRVIADDPLESPYQSLSWYGKRAMEASGVICHLTDPERHDNAIYNARGALVAGLSHALGKPILMLIEGDYLTPIDYRELASNYPNSRAAVALFDKWITPILDATATEAQSKVAVQKQAALVSQLKQLNVGDYVAENESKLLLSDYFIETAAFIGASKGESAVFTGSKGVGKSATFLKLQENLEADKRVLTIAIKPPEYDIQAVARLLTTIEDRDLRSLTLDAVWKYLLHTEIARALHAKMEDKAKIALEDEELQFLTDVKRFGFDLDQEFAHRLERKIEHYSTSENLRVAVSEDLHKGVIKDLRNSLSAVLAKRQRIAILVDNLDLAWDKANSTRLAPMILALIDAARAISREIPKSTKKSDVQVSYAIFVRSDIFEFVKRASTEPDKVSAARLDWTDLPTLARVIDERLETATRKAILPEEIWKRFFCANVKGVPAKSFILHSIKPRPRDLIFLVRAAIVSAVNRGRSKVEEDDILRAWKQYSEFAFESLKVESDIASDLLENVALALIGQPSVLNLDTISGALTSHAGLNADETEQALIALRRNGIVGIETIPGTFEFAEDESSFRRHSARAAAWRRNSGAREQFLIHPAYWAYFDLSDQEELMANWR